MVSTRIMSGKSVALYILEDGNPMNQTEKTRILIVEDEASVRELVKTFLTAKGYYVATAAGGKEAYELLKSDHFDLAILDLVLDDEVDGFQLLEWIRQEYSAQDLPVILLTGQSLSDKVVKGFELGANDYITKPADFKIIMARVAYQLKVRDQARQALSDSQTDVAAIRFEPGAMLGSYEIIDLLGKGGMGAVYKVLDTRLERVVALKTILPFRDLEDETIKRFTQEAKLIAKLNHPHIISVYDTAEEPVNYFTMEYIDGDSLKEWIYEERLETGQIGDIVRKIALALEAAHHQGIIHRDLKPSNIMMDTKGQPHLTDFGMAKLLESNQDFTKTQDMVGTPANMAPEQIDNSFGEIDPRTDVFGLGLILYEMLTRKPPFQGTPANIMWQVVYKDPRWPSEEAPEAPEYLCEICMKAISKDQNERYASADEMARAIEAGMKGEA